MLGDGDDEDPDSEKVRKIGEHDVACLDLYTFQQSDLPASNRMGPPPPFLRHRPPMKLRQRSRRISSSRLSQSVASQVSCHLVNPSQPLDTLATLGNCTMFGGRPLPKISFTRVISDMSERRFSRNHDVL